MASANRIEQIYDLKTLGGGKTISELEAIVELFKTIEQIKIRLNKMKDGITDPGTIRRVNDELDRQTKAYQNNVVKMNLVSSKTLKLASHNKELALKIIQVNDEVKNATDALNDHNKAELEAIRSAQKFYGEQKKEEQAVKSTTKALVDKTKAIQEAKILEADRMRALKNQIREELNAKGSLEQRRAALIRLNAQYDRLSPKERDTSWGVRMNSIIGSLNTQVLALEKTTGRAQRDVGNYTNAVAGGFQKAFTGLRTLAYLIPGLGIAGIMDLAITAVAELGKELGIMNSETQKAVTYLEELKNKFAEIDAQIQESEKYIDRGTQLQIARAKARGASVQELSDIEVNSYNERIKLLDSEIQKEQEELAGYRRVLSLKQAGSVAIKESVEEINNAITEGDKKIGELQQQRADSQIAIELKKLDTDAKIYEEGRKRESANSKKSEQERLKAAEESQRIINEARLNLMDEMSAEMYKRAVQYIEDEKKLVGATQEQRAAVYESYQKDIQEILDKYALKDYQAKAAREDEIIKLDQEANKREREEKKSNADALSKIDEESEKQDRARQDRIIQTKAEQRQKELEEEKKA